MILRVTEDAADDLKTIRDYIGDADGTAAERMLEHVGHVIRLLAKRPGLGTHGIVEATWEMPVPRTHYVIVYRVDLAELDELVILRVFHTAQNRE